MVVDPGWPVPPCGWPDWVWRVPYVGELHPDGPDRPIDDGANCQRYAYEVLTLFGCRIPPFRSSELWDDTSVTERVDGLPQALDLVLFNESNRAWGAHVGVALGPDEVLHLSKSVGRPEAWTLAEFEARPAYRVRVGIKRPTVVSFVRQW